MKEISQKTIKEVCNKFINKYIIEELDLVTDIEVKEDFAEDYVIWYKINERKYVHYIFNKWLRDDYQETEE